MVFRARNTAVRSENKIHDDAVAAAHGFRGGLVPGVTVYGYLASAAAGQSPEWLATGSMRVRFQAPFYDGDEVRLETDGQHRIDAFDQTGSLRASAVIANPPLAWLEFEDAPLPAYDARPDASWDLFAPGTTLGTLHDCLDLRDPEYLELHCFDALAEPSVLYQSTAHPAVLLAMANQILFHNYKLGPWIHSSSQLTNFGTAQHGDTVTVRGRIAERFEKKGHEFVVLDLAMTNSRGHSLLRVRHTAIYKPVRQT